MRLHRLELTGFGPFPDTQVVDFDALGADGLFLVQGDTGAGKTTLLDAVAFALFGRVPGPRNEAKRLRCDRAARDVVTEVRLEATIGGFRLELCRRPEYERPKSRGNGTTMQRGRVSLRWIGAGPGGRPAEGLSRVDEVGDAIIDLLGMSADQFFQVVLLPQGDFARFLRADTAERANLLERLFDTGRFGRIEEWFAAARRAAGAALRERDEEVRHRAARVAEWAGREPDDDRSRWLADVRDRLADAADCTIADAAAACAERERRIAELDKTRATAELVSRRRRLEQRRRELDRCRPDVERDRSLLVQATRSAPVVSALAASRAAMRAVAPAERGKAAAESALDALNCSVGRPDLRDLGLLADDPIAVHAAAAADRELAGRLTGIIAEAAEQDRELAALARARARHHRDEVAAVDVEQRLASLPGKISDLDRRVADARSARDLLPFAGEQRTAAERLLEAAGSVARLRPELVAATGAANAATDLHQAAVDARQALVQERIAGIATELAAALTAGEPCPVCGSCQHPVPAHHGAPVVRAEQLEAAQRAEADAAAARDIAVRRRWNLETALAGAVQTAAGNTLTQAEEQLVRCCDKHRRLTAVARNYHALLGLREAAGKALFEHGLRREDLSATLAAGAKEITVLHHRTARRAGHLLRERAGHESVPARRAFLIRRAETCDAVVAASGRLTAASSAAMTAACALWEAMTAAGFARVEDAVAVAGIDVDELTRRVRAADDEHASVRDQLSDPVLGTVSGDTVVDLDGIAARAARAAQVAEQAVAARHASVARRDQAACAARRLSAAILARQPALDRDAEVSALTEVLLGRGQNALGLSLRTYVLAERLRQVATTAGQRLDKMSAGRYTFVHSTDREARGRAGGLGLDILDGWSGLVRPAKTLSGGESFLASLALALGLADVVAAESGGRVLDTLFVDEGFGSLDPDTLDLVMGTLDELRAGGRVVGVVSHVAELRQRIPSQVRVTRTPQGSRVAVSAG